MNQSPLHDRIYPDVMTPEQVSEAYNLDAEFARIMYGNEMHMTSLCDS